MPPDVTPKTTTSRKRPAQSKRGAIACVRCKERKAKCVPAPPGTSNVPTCENCHQARATCVYLDRTPNELFLLEYVSQLENRVASLELEIAQYRPDSIHVVDHSQTQAAAIESLTEQYPPEAWPFAAAGPSGDNSKAVDQGPSPPVVPKQEEEEEGGNDDLAYGLGRLTLSGSGEPVYVGASSGVNWARVCATALRGPRASQDDGVALSRFNYLMPPESSSAEAALSYSQHHPIPPLPPPALAARYLEAAYQHIQARYSFLDWPTIRNWHDHREEIVNRPMWGAGRGKDFRRSMAAFMLWLLYGYGARLTEDEHLEGAVSHEVYHNIAVACLSNVANHTSIATVQAELLLTIYSFRHPQPEISVWQTAGLALRTAIQIGLHRKARSKAERERNPVEYEIKKRTFWTLYTIDRMLALQLGRPSGIQDRDIDVEMPLNIDVDFTDARVILDMQTRQIESLRGESHGHEYDEGYETVTSMTSAIHNARLNRLKQLIQDAIYRLDHPLESRTDVSAPIPEVDNLLLRLRAWQSASPTLPPGRSGVPLLSRGQQDMEYHNCVQMLLRPVISSRLGTDQYLPKCFDSAAALCEGQWELLNTPSTYRLSNWALYRLFLSGLTLLHLASSPSTSPHVDLSRAHRALQKCKESLSVYVRHLPAMTGYQTVLQELVSGWESKYFGGHLGTAAGSSRRAGASPERKRSQYPRASSRSPSAARPSAADATRQSGSPNSEISDPLRWLENLTSAYNPGGPQPSLHIPLHPVQPNQTNTQYVVPSAHRFDAALHNQPRHIQHLPQSGQYQGFSAEYRPTLGNSAGMMPTLNTYGVNPSVANPGSAGVAAPFNPYRNIPSQQPPANAMHTSHTASGLHTPAAQVLVSPHPQLGQLAAAPGGGVRDDFFSLLSSLGVDMDETLGSAMPPMAEDHLWTSDWGMYSLSNPAEDNRGRATSAGEGSAPIHPSDISPAISRSVAQHDVDFTQWVGDWQGTDDGTGGHADGQDGLWTFPFS